MSYLDTPKSGIFQFQNGTIRRTGKKQGGVFSNLFQFQNGTIRSGDVVGRSIWHNNFNSKMVRLEEKRHIQNNRC